jgi:hypothetical protein
MFYGLGLYIYTIFGAVVEHLTNSGVLHNQNLWALTHPVYWPWLTLTLLALYMAACTVSWLAKRALRSRTTSLQHPAQCALLTPRSGI